MRQRLGLAAALLREPRLLVLDEPTNGLDPQGIREIRELLLALNARGTTVFLSSHLLAEVEQLCTRVGVLDRGRLVMQDELATVCAPTGRVVVRTPDADQVAGVIGRGVVHRDSDVVVVDAARCPDAQRRAGQGGPAGQRARTRAAHARAGGARGGPNVPDRPESYGDSRRAASRCCAARAPG
ncbi:MAG: AAA family ATPase [Nocardioidaceae bacterium]